METLFLNVFYDLKELKLIDQFSSTGWGFLLCKNLSILQVMKHIGVKKLKNIIKI